GVEAELAATGRTASRPPSSAISTASRRTRPSPARRRLWTRAGVVVTNIEMSPLIYAPTKPGAKAHSVSDLLGESLSEAAYAANTYTTSGGLRDQPHWPRPCDRGGPPEGFTP